MKAQLKMKNTLQKFLLLSLACWNSHASAQVLYGTLLGNVQAPDASPVTRAQIVATNQETGFERTEMSGNEGEYSFHDLIPGIYKLKITAKGFASAEQTGIAVSANTATRLSPKLAVASVQQSVEVAAESSPLQTDSGDLHTELSKQQIENLPINGYRNYQSLLGLVPGATPVRYQNSVMDTPSRSLTTNINGTSRNNVATSVDGAALQQVYLPHHTLYNPSADDIEAVNIVTDSFSAEQGLAGSAVVTVVTKSGTNQIHGDLYEDHTNSAMAARNFFFLGSNVPENILNQFGATLGGPIKKNKLFFFTSYEGVDQRQNYSEIDTLPTAAERNGIFTGLAKIYDPSTGGGNPALRTQFAGNIVPASQFTPASVKMLSLVPLPNLPGNASNYYVGANYGLNRHSLDEKVTWQIDDKSSLFGKFSFMDAHVNSASTLGLGGGTGLSPGGSNSGSGNSSTQVFVGGIGYTRALTPSLLVDGNFGFGRNNLFWVEDDYGTNYGSNVLGIPGTNGTDLRQSGLPSFAISGFETFGNPDAYTPEIKADNIFTYVANLAWTRGKHTLRFGTQDLHNGLNEFQPQRGFGPRGGFTFTGGSTALQGGSSPTSANSFADFLLGDAATLGKSYQYLDPITVSESQFAIYAQDQWLATPKLTITYGLRWEYYPIISRANRGIERYDPTTNSVLLGGVGNVPSNAGTSANPHQFAPRFGLAYRINEKTVFRGGYGISVDSYPFSRAMRDPYPVTVAQQITSTSSYLPAGTLAAGIPAIAPISYGNGIIPLPLTAYTKTLPAGQFNRGYVESFNVTLERQLPLHLDLSSAYVGTRTIHQTAYVEENAGQIPGAGAAGQPLYPLFGRTAETQEILPYNTANYNALQVSLKRRFTQGISLSAAYTFSKSIDFGSDDDSTPLINAVAYEARNRAVSDFDRTHVFQMGFVAELPFGKGKPWLASGGVINTLVSGWQFSGVFSAYTGTPFTPTASATSLNAAFNTQFANQIKASVATLNGIGSNATWFDTSAYAAVSTAAFGSAGRNSLRGPGAANLDLSLNRRFTISERIHLELRGEAFNLSNSPIFANPGSNASSGSFGHITATAGTAADSRVLRVSGKITF
jgi:hypothetical protein